MSAGSRRAPGRSCGCDERRGCISCRDGYATANEWWTKRRRLDVLRSRLVETDRRLAAKDYAVVFGGRRLLNTRHYLDKAGITLTEWRQQWSSERLFLSCVGNVGKTGGNPCLTLTQDADGLVWLSLSVPEPVQRRLGVGARVRLTPPVPVGHVPELVERVTARASTAISITFQPGKRGEKVLLRASWSHEQLPVVPDLAQLRTRRIVSLDLNADHLALARLNPDGNPVGSPVRIRSSSRACPPEPATPSPRFSCTRSGSVQLRSWWRSSGSRSRRPARSTAARKSFRALISGFPTAAFRNRLVPMAHRTDLAVIAVDPRYTSKAGGRDWQQSASPFGGHPCPSGRAWQR